MISRIAAGALVVVSVGLAAPQGAKAATYQVGPGQEYRQLTDLPTLQPGDVVEVAGNATYDGDIILDDGGTAAQPITIRGIRADGNRPVISGGSTGVEFRASHYVMEGFDITAASVRCVFHHADDITIRDTVVHHCPEFAIIGADNDSGSLTLSYVEVHNNGNSDRRHQIYMATDQAAYPGSVFRLEHSYIHSGTGGNNIKSRAERNEIYYNWIEGGPYHEIELIGPEVVPSEGLAREDSDVACNVIRKTGSNADFYTARFGGDGTGQTWGRYRFVNNTVILSASTSDAVFRLFDGIECLEIHNNAFVREGGSAGIDIWSNSNVSWASGEAIGGHTNWVPNGSTDVPADFEGTVAGGDPRLENLAGFDLRPAEGSPLIDAGTASPPSPPEFPFPSPLTACAYHPPARRLEEPGTATPRPQVGVVDIGAYEFGSGPPVDPDDPDDPDDPNDPDDPSDPNDPGSGDGDVEGGCSVDGGYAGLAGALVVALLLGLALRRRRSGAV